MWRTQTDLLLIYIGNKFFILKLYKHDEYERALSKGHWTIGENYLHVQRWKPNFSAEEASIAILPVQVHFLSLQVEYYNESWLRRAEEQIGKTIKVDSTTLATT